MKKPRYTFSPEKRYLTRGIDAQVSKELQILMWQSVEELVKSETETDYLQVFELSLDEEKNHIKIKHTQEQPPFENTIHIKAQESFLPLPEAKIFVIDDLTHSTMLLASEY